jgi:hypothetical protein
MTNRNEFPPEWRLMSEKQKTLEAQGCVFRGQERLDNHEIDPNKECYCGRPNTVHNKHQRLERG